MPEKSLDFMGLLYATGGNLADIPILEQRAGAQARPLSVSEIINRGYAQNEDQAKELYAMQMETYKHYVNNSYSPYQASLQYEGTYPKGKGSGSLIMPYNGQIEYGTLGKFATHTEHQMSEMLKVYKDKHGYWRDIDKPHRNILQYERGIDPNNPIYYWREIQDDEWALSDRVRTIFGPADVNSSVVGSAVRGLVTLPAEIIRGVGGLVGTTGDMYAKIAQRDWNASLSNNSLIKSFERSSTNLADVMTHKNYDERVGMLQDVNAFSWTIANGIAQVMGMYMVGGSVSKLGNALMKAKMASGALSTFEAQQKYAKIWQNIAYQTSLILGAVESGSHWRDMMREMGIPDGESAKYFWLYSGQTYISEIILMPNITSKLAAKSGFRKWTAQEKSIKFGEGLDEAGGRKFTTDKQKWSNLTAPEKARFLNKLRFQLHKKKLQLDDYLDLNTRGAKWGRTGLASFQEFFEEEIEQVMHVGTSYLANGFLGDRAENINKIYSGVKYTPVYYPGYNVIQYYIKEDPTGRKTNISIDRYNDEQKEISFAKGVEMGKIKIDTKFNWEEGLAAGISTALFHAGLNVFTKSSKTEEEKFSLYDIAWEYYKGNINEEDIRSELDKFKRQGFVDQYTRVNEKGQILEAGDESPTQWDTIVDRFVDDVKIKASWLANSELLKHKKIFNAFMQDKRLLFDYMNTYDDINKINNAIKAREDGKELKEDGIIKGTETIDELNTLLDVKLKDLNDIIMPVGYDPKGNKYESYTLPNGVTDTRELSLRAYEYWNNGVGINFEDKRIAEKEIDQKIKAGEIDPVNRESEIKKFIDKRNIELQKIGNIDKGIRPFILKAALSTNLADQEGFYGWLLHNRNGHDSFAKKLYENDKSRYSERKESSVINDEIEALRTGLLTINRDLFKTKTINEEGNRLDIAEQSKFKNLLSSINSIISDIQYNTNATKENIENLNSLISDINTYIGNTEELLKDDNSLLGYIFGVNEGDIAVEDDQKEYYTELAGEATEYINRLTAAETDVSKLNDEYYETQDKYIKGDWNSLSSAQKKEYGLRAFNEMTDLILAKYNPNDEGSTFAVSDLMYYHDMLTKGEEIPNPEGVRYFLISFRNILDTLIDYYKSINEYTTDFVENSDYRETSTLIGFDHLRISPDQANQLIGKAQDYISKIDELLDAVDENTKARLIRQRKGTVQFLELEFGFLKHLLELDPNLDIKEIEAAEKLFEAEGYKLGEEWIKFYDAISKNENEEKLLGLLNKLEELKFKAYDNLSGKLDKALENLLKEGKTWKSIIPYTTFYQLERAIPIGYTDNVMTGLYTLGNYIDGRDKFAANPIVDHKSDINKMFYFAYTAKWINRINLYGNKKNNSPTFSKVLNAIKAIEKSRKNTIEEVPTTEQLYALIDFIGWYYNSDNTWFTENPKSKALVSWMQHINNTYTLLGFPGSGKTVVMNRDIVLTLAMLNNEKKTHITIVIPSDGLKAKYIKIYDKIIKFNKNISYDIQYLDEYLRTGKVDEKANLVIMDEGSHIGYEPNDEETGKVLNQPYLILKSVVEKSGKKLLILGDIGQIVPLKNTLSNISALIGAGEKSAVLGLRHRTKMEAINKFLNYLADNMQNPTIDIFKFIDTEWTTWKDGYNLGLRYNTKGETDVITEFIKTMDKLSTERSPLSAMLIAVSREHKNEMLANYPSLNKYFDNIYVLDLELSKLIASKNDDYIKHQRKFNASGLEADFVYFPLDFSKPNSYLYISESAIGGVLARIAMTYLNTMASRAIRYVEMSANPKFVEEGLSKQREDGSDLTGWLYTMSQQSLSSEEILLDRNIMREELINRLEAISGKDVGANPITPDVDETGIFTENLSEEEKVILADEFKDVRNDLLKKREEYNESTGEGYNRISDTNEYLNYLSKAKDQDEHVGLTDDGDVITIADRLLMAKSLRLALMNTIDANQDDIAERNTEIENNLKQLSYLKKETSVEKLQARVNGLMNSLKNMTGSVLLSNTAIDPLSIINPTIADDETKTMGHPLIIRIVGYHIVDGKKMPIVDIHDASITNTPMEDSMYPSTAYRLASYAWMLYKKGFKVNGIYLHNIGTERNAVYGFDFEYRGVISLSLANFADFAEQLNAIYDITPDPVTEDEFYQAERDINEYDNIAVDDIYIDKKNKNVLVDRITKKRIKGVDIVDVYFVEFGKTAILKKNIKTFKEDYRKKPPEVIKSWFRKNAEFHNYVDGMPVVAMGNLFFYNAAKDQKDFFVVDKNSLLRLRQLIISGNTLFENTTFSYVYIHNAKLYDTKTGKEYTQEHGIYLKINNIKKIATTLFEKIDEANIKKWFGKQNIESVNDLIKYIEDNRLDYIGNVPQPEYSFGLVYRDSITGEEQRKGNTFSDLPAVADRYLKVLNGTMTLDDAFEGAFAEEEKDGTREILIDLNKKKFQLLKKGYDAFNNIPESKREDNIGIPIHESTIPIYKNDKGNDVLLFFEGIPSYNRKKRKSYNEFLAILKKYGLKVQGSPYITKKTIHYKEGNEWKSKHISQIAVHIIREHGGTQLIEIAFENEVADLEYIQSLINILNEKYSSGTEIEALLEKLDSLRQIKKGKERNEAFKEIMRMYEATEAYTFLNHNLTLIKNNIHLFKGLLEIHIGRNNVEEIKLVGLGSMQYDNLIKALRIIADGFNTFEETLYKSPWIPGTTRGVVQTDNIFTYFEELHQGHVYTTTDGLESKTRSSNERKRSHRREEGDTPVHYVYNPAEVSLNKLGYNYDRDAITEVLTDIIGKKNIKNVLFNDDALNELNNGAVLGYVHNAILSLHGLNFRYSKYIARHEAMHYILKYLLKPSQHREILEQAKEILREKIEDPSDIDAHEYLAELFQNKDYERVQFKKPGLLRRFINWLKSIFDNWVDNITTIEELLYKADMGVFKDANIVGNGLLHDPINDVYDDLKTYSRYNFSDTNEQAKKRLIDTFGTQSEVEFIRDYIVLPAIKQNSPYGKSFSDYGGTTGSIIYNTVEAFKLNRLLLENYYTDKDGEEIPITYYVLKNGEAVKREFVTEDGEVLEMYWSETYGAIYLEALQASKEHLKSGRKTNMVFLADYRRYHLADEDIIFPLLAEIFPNTEVRAIYEYEKTKATKNFSKKQKYIKDKSQSPLETRNPLLQVLLSTIPYYDLNSKSFIPNKYVNYYALDKILFDAATKVKIAYAPSEEGHSYDYLLTELGRMVYSSPGDTANIIYSFLLEYGNRSIDNPIYGRGDAAYTDDMYYHGIGTIALRISEWEDILASYEETGVSEMGNKIRKFTEPKEHVFNAKLEAHKDLYRAIANHYFNYDNIVYTKIQAYKGEIRSYDRDNGNVDLIQKKAIQSNIIDNLFYNTHQVKAHIVRSFDPNSSKHFIVDDKGVYEVVDGVKTMLMPRDFEGFSREMGLIKEDNKVYAKLLRFITGDNAINVKHAASIRSFIKNHAHPELHYNHVIYYMMKSIALSVEINNELTKESNLKVSNDTIKSISEKINAFAKDVRRDLGYFTFAEDKINNILRFIDDQDPNEEMQGVAEEGEDNEFIAAEFNGEEFSPYILTERYLPNPADFYEFIENMVAAAFVVSEGEQFIRTIKNIDRKNMYLLRHGSHLTDIFPTGYRTSFVSAKIGGEKILHEISKNTNIDNHPLFDVVSDKNGNDKIVTTSSIIERRLSFDGFEILGGIDNYTESIKFNKLNEADMFSMMIKNTIYFMKRGGFAQIPVLLDTTSDRAAILTTLMHLYDGRDPGFLYHMHSDKKKKRLYGLNRNNDMFYKFMLPLLKYKGRVYENAKNDWKKYSKEVGAIELDSQSAKDIIFNLYEDYHYKNITFEGKQYIIPGNAIVMPKKFREKYDPKFNISYHNIDFDNIKKLISGNAKDEIIKMIDKAFAEELRNFGKEVKRMNLQFDDDIINIFGDFVFEVNGEEISLDDSNEDYAEKRRTKFAEREEAKELRDAKKKQYDAENNEKTKAQLKQEYDALVKEYDTLDKEFNALKSERDKQTGNLRNLILANDYTNGRGRLHPLLEMMFWHHHIFNENISQLVRGDEEYFANAEEHSKRDGFVASGERIFAPTDRLHSYGANEGNRFVRMLIYNDIPSGNRLYGTQHNAKGSTDGSMIVSPLQALMNYHDAGGGLSNVSDEGSQKTVYYNWDPIKRQILYLKHNMFIPSYSDLKETKYRDILQVMFKPIWNIPVDSTDLIPLENPTEDSKTWGNRILSANSQDEFMNTFVNLLKRMNSDQRYRELSKQFIGFIGHPSGVKKGSYRVYDYKTTDDNPLSLDNATVDTETEYETIEIDMSKMRFQTVTEQDVDNTTIKMGTQLMTLPGNFASNHELVAQIDAQRAEQAQSYLNDLNAITEKINKHIIDNELEGEEAIEYGRQVRKDYLLNLALRHRSQISLGKYGRLLSDKNITPDVFSDNIVNSLLSEVNHNLQVHVPGQGMIKALGDRHVMWLDVNGRRIPVDNKRSSAIGTDSSILKPVEYFFEGKKINDKDELIRLIDENPGKVIVRPGDAVGPFVNRSSFFIDEKHSISDVMLLSGKVKGEEQFVNLYDEAGTDYRSNHEYAKEIKQLYNNVFGAKFKLGNLLSLWDPSFRSNIIQILEKAHDGDINELSPNSMLDILGEYYYRLNRSLDIIVDRIPTSNGSSAHIYRLVEFDNNMSNSIKISPEANLLDGSDYDADMYRVFFMLLNGSVADKIDKGENRIFKALRKFYLSTDTSDNIRLILEATSYGKIIEKSNEIEESIPSYINNLATTVRRTYLNQSSQRLVGHFANHVVFTSLLQGIDADTKKNLFSTDMKLFKSENKEQIAMAISLLSAWINGAVDATNIGGKLASININENTSTLIHGLLVTGYNPSNDVSKIEDDIYNLLNSPLAKGVVQAISDSNMLYTKQDWNRYKSNIQLLEQEGNDYSAYKEQYPVYDVFKNEYNALRKGMLAGEAIFKIQPVYKLTQGIKGPLSNILKSIDRIERALGQNINDFVAGIPVTPEEQARYTVERFNKPKEKTALEDMPEYKYELERREMFNVNAAIRQIAFLNQSLDTFIKTFDFVKEQLTILQTDELLRPMLYKLIGRKSFSMDKHYELYLRELNNMYIGMFLDEVKKETSLIFEEDGVEVIKKYNLGYPKHRIEFVEDFVEFIKYVKKLHQYKDNAFIKQISTRRSRYDDVILMVFRNSINIDPHTITYFSQQFDLLDDVQGVNLKEAFRIYQLLVYGFHYKSGSFIDGIDTEIEKEYSAWVSKSPAVVYPEFLTDLLARIPELLEKYSDTAIYLSNKEKNDHTRIMIDRNDNSYTIPYSRTINTWVRRKTHSKNTISAPSLSQNYLNKLYSTGEVEVRHYPGVRMYSRDMAYNINTVHTDGGIYLNKYGDAVRMTATNRGWNKHGLAWQRTVKYKLINNNKDIVVRELSDLREGRIHEEVLDILLERMQSIFPNIRIVSLTEDEAVQIDQRDSVLGQTKAFIENGVLYIVPTRLRATTPLHELGHILIYIIKTVDPVLYKSLLDQARQLDMSNNAIIAHLRRLYENQGLDTETWLNEIIANVIGLNTQEKVYGLLLSLADDNARTISKSFFGRISDIFKSIVDAIKDYIKNIFGNPISKLETIDDIGDYLLDAIKKGKKVSNITSNELAKIMNYQSYKEIGEDVKKFKTARDIYDFFYVKSKGTMWENFNDKQKVAYVLDQMEGNEINLFNKKIKVTDPADPELHKIILDALKKEMSQEGDIRNRFISFLNAGGTIELFKKHFEGTNIRWETMTKVLQAIEYNTLNKHKKYHFYSDLLKLEGFSKYYNDQFLGFDPIIAIEYNGTNQPIISIYDVTLDYITVVDQESIPGLISDKLYNERTWGKRMVGRYNGFTLTNRLIDGRRMMLSLLANYMMYKDSNLSIYKMGIIRPNNNHGVHPFYYIDHNDVNNNLRLLAQATGFIENIESTGEEIDLKKMFSNNMFRTINQNYVEGIRQLWENRDLFQNEYKRFRDSEQMTNEDIIKVLLMRLRVLLKRGTSNNVDRMELHYIMGTIKQLTDIGVINEYRNPFSKMDMIQHYFTSADNVPNELVMFIRDKLLTAGYLLVQDMSIISARIDPLLEYFDKKYGDKLVSLGKDQGNMLYDSIMHYVTDKNGNKVFSGLFYWTNVVTPDMDKIERMLAEEAKKKGVSNQDLAMGKKMMEEITEMMAKNVLHEKVIRLNTEYDRWNKSENREYTIEDARKDLRDKTKWNYSRGMIPLMEQTFSSMLSNLELTKAWKKGNTMLADPHDVFIESISRNETNKGMLIHQLSDVFIHQFKAESISTNYGNLTRANKIGVTETFDENGNKYTLLIDKNKNMGISKDMEVNMKYFMLSSLRNQYYEDNVLPLLNAAIVLYQDMQDYEGLKDEAFIKHAIGYLNDYAIMAIEGKRKKFEVNSGINFDSLIMGTLGAVRTGIMTLNPNIAMMNTIPNFMYSFIESIANTVSENGRMSTKNLMEANGIYFRDFKLVIQLLKEFQLIAMEDYDYVRNRLRMKTKHTLLSSFYGNIMSFGADSYARGIIMIAQMLQDGSYHAYSLDENGKLKYDIKKDLQYYKDGQMNKLQKARFDLILANRKRHGLQQQSDTDLTGSYDYKEIRRFKYIANRFVIGSYTNKARIAAGNYTLGKVLTMFTLWVFDRITNAFGPYRRIEEGGRYIFTEKDGEIFAQWESEIAEGYTITMIKLAMELITTGKVTSWRNMETYQKYNVAKFSSTVLLYTIGMLLYNLLVNQSKDDDKPLPDWRVLRNVQYALMSLFAIGNIFDVIADPFKALDIIKRSFYDISGGFRIYGLTSFIPGNRLYDFIDRGFESK